MQELLDRIDDLLAGPAHDRAQVERTLTDGYAHALSLEAEGRRLQRRLAELAQSAHLGDTDGKAHELSQLAHRLDGASGELSELRAVLAQLRRRLN
jgi:hypothetical protein